MLYFLDTEFIEDGRTIDLISIGIVADDGREFYAVSTEADLERANDWVRTHVLPKLPPRHCPEWMSRKEIRERLETFVRHAGYWDQPSVPIKCEFWGYYADYDWVALCQLFGTMMDLPSDFPKFCRDLKQLSVDVGSPRHPDNPGEHSALADARWNRDLYRFLQGLRALKA
jgi:hypothetical protein